VTALRYWNGYIGTPSFTGRGVILTTPFRTKLMMSEERWNAAARELTPDERKRAAASLWLARRFLRETVGLIAVDRP
jgi:hypothetical protein